MTRHIRRSVVFLLAPIVSAAVACLFVPATVAAGEIRGRVLVEGKPAVGTSVSVVPFEDAFTRARREARAEGDPKPLAGATTRADGTFTVVVPASAGPAGTAVRLAISGGGALPVMLERVLDAAGGDAGDVRLGRAAPLAGRVVDERGGPVVGATVTLWAGRGRMLDDLSAVEPVPQAATTKADGTFRFEATAAEGNRLRVEAPVFAAQERASARSGALLKPVTLTVGRVLRGTVMMPDKRTPAGGALVRFEGRATTRWFEARPDGTFLIEGAPAESGSIVAEGGDRGRISAPVAVGAAGPVALVLAPTAALRGRVVDADTGRPIAGVRLVARAEGSAAFLARSAFDGRYEIRALPPQRYRLEADDERFVPSARQVTVVAGQVETQDVPLLRGAALVGRVVGEDGAPVEGAVLSLVRAGESPFRALLRQVETEGERVRTARDGAFRATRLPPGENQRLDVRHDEFEERSLGGISLAPGATRSGVTVVLRRGLSVRGVVKDDVGRPLAGVEVTLERPRTFRAGRGQVQFSFIGPGSRPRRETGADGRFEFRGLQAGDYTLSATRRGMSRATVDPVKVAEGRGAEPVELTLRPGTTISGLLRDRSGSGAAGWLVFARPSGEGGAPGLGPGALRTEEPTGPDGAFLLEGLNEGASYDLQAMGPPGLGPRRAGVTAPADGVELTVAGSGQIRGQILDAESGRPVPDFELSYTPDASGGMRMVFRAAPGRGRGPYERQSFHAEDGTFVLEDVPAGKWSVEARASGYQKGSAAGVSVDEGGTAEGVEVRLSKGGIISGRVLETRTGRPILDAAVRAELSGGGGGPVFSMGGEAADNEATTDADGRYEITGLATGSWTVSASHPEWSEASANVELKDGPATVDLRLGHGGSIGGAVLAGGRPVAGAQVGLSTAGEAGFGGRGFGGGGDQATLSDPAGRFRFDRLTPGRYALGATLRSQSSTPVEAVVTGDGSQDVTLTLAEGAAIHGTVSGLPDTARSGVNVMASGPDQFFASTRTGADGAFELTGVPEGTISLNARAGDFITSSRSASASVTIGPGQAEAAVEIVFEQGVRVDGRVTRGGRPVADAVVMAFSESSGGRSATARTDEAGGFVLEGLREGEYTISANPQNGAPIRRQVTLSGDTTVDLEAPPARLAGTVVEVGSGRPLDDVAVEIGDEGGGMQFVNRASTDSSGRFSFENLEPRAYRLSFQKPAYEAETRQVAAAEDSDMRVELRRGEGIGLVARDGIYGTPLRGLMVRVVDGQGVAAFTGSVPLDSDGRGEVPALKAGGYELRAESSGYAPVFQPTTVPSVDLTLMLTPGGTLEIQAGPQTLALPQAAGHLVGADGRVYLPSIFSSDGKIRITGPVRRLENVVPGRYTFEVEGGARREVTIAEGGTAVVALP
jgi:protocatechuate 3,4-dioxygenase beta subunit